MNLMLIVNNIILSFNNWIPRQSFYVNIWGRLFTLE